MDKRYTQVPLEYLTPIFNEWFATFARGELVNVFFLPKGDILFRSLQFADWVRDNQKAQVNLVNFESELIVNPANLQSVLHKYSSENVVLILKHELFQPDAVGMVAVLEQWYASMGKGILLLHEGFPSELAQYVPLPVMKQKQIVHKIYPTNVAKKYTQTTARMFDVLVDEEWIQKVVSYCGGIPWLINDVLRRSTDQELFDNETFLWKVEQIAKAIPNVEGVNNDLLSFDLIDLDGQWIPVIGDYIARMNKQEFFIDEAQIVWKSRDYTRDFSAGERRILHKLVMSNAIVSRETLGKIFWQNEEDSYSDWALDAIVSRLRRKITRLGLPVTITTRRGRGYEIAT